MDLGLQGKLAVVTGASSGIGRATARALAAEGARLVLSDLGAEALRRGTEDVPNVLERVAADLTREKGAAAIARAARAKGGADILVEAAGITGEKGDPFAMTDAAFRDCFETNFLGPVRLARALVGPMAERGWGRIVFIVSENAVQPYPEEAVYNASKAALLNFTKSAALAYGPKGVLVNAVAPAFIETPMTEGMMRQRAGERGETVEEAVDSFLKEERPYLTLDRRGQPEEVAAVIALLCSERASFVSGASYRVDGGSVAAMNT
ncbi:SDR family NAD(P)-dependent oxidoreductase [Celeribacter indicus]|uniref:3-oxoacyl-ACP reductase n=1 Tax=Celeribacter indicus TaxID=1208324 RepID=A0A0B5E1C9_9RHOB|nr:SDR family oxidoreductase [Celeribacter indicus]AJE49084.1 3-oxoacyl-ACP reductase [Celeribacter indicus]SDW45465.1 NAD(P)-dependent dehydrogenase, short-chain alcohol dehydrogenase family [Celeribacter indicus]